MINNKVIINTSIIELGIGFNTVHTYLNFSGYRIDVINPVG